MCGTRTSIVSAADVIACANLIEARNYRKFAPQGLMAELLAPTGLKIIELRRDNLGVWFIETAPGVRLVVGRDQVSEKLRRFNRVWAEGLSQQLKNIKTIDLRYPNGLAVAWKDGITMAAQENIQEKGKAGTVQA